MANMNYCRFQNTEKDLYDCVQALRDYEPLSEAEIVAMRNMVELAEELIELAEDVKEEKE